MTRPEETDSQIRSAALAYLASPWHVLAFAPAMERAFRADTLAGRLRRYRSFGLVGILIYMAYTGVDWFALHDIFPSIWPWRLLGMPLITGSVIALSFWRRFQPWCDLGMVGATTLGTLALVVFFSLSLTPASNHYYGGVLLCGVYLMFVLRTGFVPTAWGCGFILAGFTLALEGLQGVDPPTRLVIAAVTASTLLLGLAGLYQLERDERRSYALALLRRMAPHWRKPMHGWRSCLRWTALPGCSTGGPSRPGCTKCGRPRPQPGARSGCCSSMWTNSRRLTISMAIRLGTRCSGRWRAFWRLIPVPLPTSPHATVARSFWCSCPAVVGMRR